MSGRVLYLVYCCVAAATLMAFNSEVTHPYMDEPFHVPQALSYCMGEWSTWDSKITTPPGLYLLSVLLRCVLMFRCTLSTLRSTVTFVSFALPLFLDRLLSLHRQRPPPPLLSPTAEAVVLSTFPLAWFYAFLYYTEVPSLVSVLGTIVFSMQSQHCVAAVLGLTSCFFRQTNIVWVLYAFCVSQLMRFRCKRGDGSLYDPPALTAGLADFIKSIISLPNAVPQLLPPFVPYMPVLALFGGFVFWNDGIVLGDKANHVPVMHVPQLYYFIAFATLLGWPVVALSRDGPTKLAAEVLKRMIGTKRRMIFTAFLSALMAISVNRFTIHHPFLLSDNRHYTFYVWRRVFMKHPVVPYLFIPGYQACAWAWWLRVARNQSLLQTLVLPLAIMPTLLPTPLLEPRYFLIPYILLRAQVVDMGRFALVLEGLWYAAINLATTYVFLYKERPGVGRFMW
ncbi:glycosyltransferase family 59 protein [Scleroderma citrinum Foug A]|uniref:Dol-P-Glc:Glc(2)Man(9)GlcNAc(2)-PP-Dol alpha-1,2-glucosyltransferase n=1 Tax=Scleroderma citrinum Foug A TaxID=1036808 RepID=A0A0C3E2F8_9AGAM|nr:glycosyltransferase family 59 protein [Scleroderma citrinum Foug A]